MIFFKWLCIGNAICCTAAFIGCYGLYFLPESHNLLFYVLIFYAPIGVFIAIGLLPVSLYLFIKNKMNGDLSSSYANIFSVILLLTWWLLISSGFFLSA